MIDTIITPRLRHPPGWFRGILAGAVGGVVGTLAMAAVQQTWMRLTLRLNARAGGPADEDRNRLKNAGVGRGEYPQSEPRSHHLRVSPSERLIANVFRKIGVRPASSAEMKTGGSAAHFAFGATVGALYGAMAERTPKITAGRGIAFGTAVLIVADEIILPLTTLAESPFKTPLRRHGYSLASHLAYGIATEAVRALLRGKNVRYTH